MKPTDRVVVLTEFGVFGPYQPGLKPEDAASVDQYVEQYRTAGARAHVVNLDAFYPLFDALRALVYRIDRDEPVPIDPKNPLFDPDYAAAKDVLRRVGPIV